MSCQLNLDEVFNYWFRIYYNILFMSLKNQPYDNPVSIKNSKLSTKKTNMY
jgi:hypothetical protein